MLLLGEDLNRSTNYAKAREVFLGVLARSSHSPFLPELEYAIARTHDYEGHWTEAITRYKQWETNHAGDSLLPEVDFHLALALVPSENINPSEARIDWRQSYAHCFAHCRTQIDD